MTELDEHLESSPPRHGGDLASVIQRFSGENSDWLDLSTGISPWAYPIPELNEQLWRELPPSSSKLLSAAELYYGCDKSNIAVTPGSQLTIRLMPSIIREKHSVAVPQLGYQEHAYAWALAGHELIYYQSAQELSSLVKNGSVNSVVVINPNNPSCETFNANELLHLAKNLSGLLVVDEAFADLDKQQSLCAYPNTHPDIKNTIVLRSIGKFFGLAGARVGFIISQNKVAKELGALFSPWSINAAAQNIAEQALTNIEWQTMQRTRIQQQSSELSTLLNQSIEYTNLDISLSNQGLFTTLIGAEPDIKNLHTKLAEQCIWTRLGDPFYDQKQRLNNWLRLSLPGNSFKRFADTLTNVITNLK